MTSWPSSARRSPATELVAVGVAPDVRRPAAATIDLPSHQVCGLETRPRAEQSSRRIHVSESHAPLDRAAVFEIVRASLADILEIDGATITEGQSFVDDLEADSLALIELVEALEEEMAERSVGFRIEDEDLEDLKTVRDAVDYVFARVQAA